MALANAVNAINTAIQSLTSGGVFNGRTITGTANQVAVANGDGISGNPTISLTSTIYVGGISFDSGSNTLSAYSSGTFTPVVQGSTGNPTVGYAADGQVGFYQRIGNKVEINVSVILSSISGGSGDVRLAQLPFTSLNSTNAVSVTGMIIGSTTLAASTWYQGLIGPNLSYVVVQGSSSAAPAANLQVSGLGASSNFAYGAYFNV